MTGLTRKDVFIQNVGLLFVLMLLLGVVGYLIIQIETENRDTNRATAYRLCSRTMIDRAYQHSKTSPATRIRLEREEGLPILDCSPNLQGTGARIMTLGEQREFVRRWKMGELSNEELGICPESVIGDPGEAKNCR